MSTAVTLNLQTQVVSILDVLVKSAIAEISKVIDEGTEILLLEMSRNKKENKTLKRRLLQMEKELQSARRGGKMRALTGDRMSVKVQVGDDIRESDMPDGDSYEEEGSLSIDGVFGKEWSISLWNDRELAAKKEEEALLQPVISEATHTVDERPDLLSVKVELFDENLEDSDPQGGLNISGCFELESDSAEQQYSEEFDPQPAPTEVTEEPYAQATVAGGRIEQHTLSVTMEGTTEPHACPAPPWTTEGSEDARPYFLRGQNTNVAKGHDGRKLQACTHCGRNFSYFVSFLKHQQTCSGISGSHFGEKFESKHSIYREGHFYSCAVCQKSFTNINTFTQYQCNRTVEKSHRCLECGKCFTERSSLQLHQRTIHAGEKPYSCAECGKNFTQKANLQKHQVIHTGEKPYKCLECGKRFTEKGYLKKHYDIHRGVKPYRCRECGNCFYHKAVLNTHERNHRKRLM